VGVVENAGRPDQRIVTARLATLEPDLTAAGLSGPALIMLGLAPRNAAQAGLPVAEAAS
jgi:uroporphyrin-III C-methyltransferase/precorrin-2 dehydrogenase/sirohydrochlorin ferrochelatase